MKKNLLIACVIFLSLANSCFACGCCPKGTFTACNEQKACQNVFALIALDLSFLSPRATAADVHIGKPKRCCFPWMHKCCPQPCAQPCMPQCCPSVPQCCPCPSAPGCGVKSMGSEDDDDLEASAQTKQEEIIPVANKQEKEEIKQPSDNPKSKTSWLRINFLRNSKK